MSEIISKLKDDAMYYGDYGKKWLSNSDVKVLLESPALYLQEKETTKPMYDGKLFHWFILEPEKAKEAHVVDVSTRNTKAYKEYLLENGLEHAYLRSEYDSLERLAAIMTSNMTFYDLIFADGNQYEVPAVAEIFGLPWKGKCDILHNDFIIDLKTTSDLNAFKYSAKKYYYDSQAYVYGQLFGKPLMFLVIDKETEQLGIFHCSDDFVAGGELRAERAAGVFRTFFGDNPTQTISSYFIEDTL